ncbi:tripartite tricarboxylate transporter TctB family protein [Petroclostridium sp. X23]|uniref:tripartite tricarboxylate transporter TctB family protein n=1 Tax=Petroclostridium sp. X23 TaxID=3045146 RepID=UPI0024AD21DA|nr:tripartite tricarboxylate transporter TctB family protein [Petroclostridium sp. X23]WHH57629.1 tripartite tricarboxylate transporter TctB family protein [Petroclostridium sp. X23]
MIKRYGDIISGAFMLLVAVGIFSASFSIKMLTVSRIGAAFIPQLISGGIALLSVIIIINSVKKLKMAGDVQEDEEQEPIRGFSVLGTIAILILYIALLESIGFIIMTAAYLFAQFTILADKSQRKLPMFAIIAVVIAVAVYYLFVSVFSLMLPPGILG